MKGVQSLVLFLEKNCCPEPIAVHQRIWDTGIVFIDHCVMARTFSQKFVVSLNIVTMLSENFLQSFDGVPVGGWSFLRKLFTCKYKCNIFPKKSINDIALKPYIRRICLYRTKHVYVNI